MVFCMRDGWIKIIGIQESHSGTSNSKRGMGSQKMEKVEKWKWRVKMVEQKDKRCGFGRNKIGKKLKSYKGMGVGVGCGTRQWVKEGKMNGDTWRC